MTPAFALLGLLAANGLVTIDDVVSGVDAEKGRVTVAVTTSEPVEARDVWAKLAKGRLNVYFMGGHVRGDRRRFTSAERVVDVLPRTEYAKVEVPYGEGVACAGAVQIEPT